jgi:hypothetical protein
MLRFLLVEAAQVTARSIPEWRSKYFHLLIWLVWQNLQGERNGALFGVH